MKWNILVASMVLGLGLSTQGFGFDLLDRMLGANGCGCEAKCGAEQKDACQKKAGCGLFGRACCKKGCDDKGAEQTCGAEHQDSSQKKKQQMGFMAQTHSSTCESAHPGVSCTMQQESAPGHVPQSAGQLLQASPSHSSHCPLPQHWPQSCGQV